ncbi:MULTISPECIES: hypothetical protein [unclassified Paenibacillus]|uniref:hypothetical protein n=1 Tax=unclassified Paenibacillus TaxID=185978 RepID=UPI00034E24EE|nr:MULTISPECIES: hypothetical protein [unclassified Paenibacillus]EPD81384.1 hypothetical protein HMPREF1207_05142 [Paenibacillus sp. HGH0039]
MDNKFNINKTYLPLVLTAEQIIQVLGIGRRAGYELLKAPPFPVRRLGKRGTIKASRDALFNWLESKESGA